MFNEDVLDDKALKEVILVEGELDTLALLSIGVTNVMGLPGANVSKAMWLKKIDDSAIETVYLLYDSDSVGQKAAKEMAIRIGINKVRNVVLPQFEFVRSDGESVVGKDINEFICSTDNAAAEFRKLLEAAKPIDVEGVQTTLEVLSILEERIKAGGTAALLPEFDTPWPSFNRKLGGMSKTDLVGVLAPGKVGKTTFALNWLEYLVNAKKVNAFMFCQEMPPERMIRKWMSHVLQLQDSPDRCEITLDSIKDAKEHALNREAELFFGYTTWKKSDEVFDTIRQVVRRYNVKVVCFDNLHLLIRSMEQPVMETSILSKKFKALAMELQIAIVLILQPNKIRPGEIAGAHNAKWTSDIEKDVDALVVLHRNAGEQLDAEILATQKIIDTEQSFAPEMLAVVDRTRYAPGGACTLWMDGATSTVREITEDMTALVVKPQNDNVPIVL